MFYRLAGRYAQLVNISRRRGIHIQSMGYVLHRRDEIKSMCRKCVEILQQKNVARRGSADQALPVATHESYNPQAPAMRLTNPVKFSGMPTPFSKHQWMHNGAHIVLLTRLFFQDLISKRSASASSALISSVSTLPAAARFSAKRLLRSTC